MVEGTFMSQREAELSAGRERVQERMGNSEKTDKRHMQRLFKDADREREEDERRREEILNATGLEDKAVLDRAGAEVADQAQTMLEALGHLADREEKITTVFQQREMEALEGNADPDAATEMAVDATTAQAVNQPTVLANNAGVPTEDRALNVTGLTTVAPLPIPDERHVPKTRKRAEQIAKAKVPSAQELVRPGWHGDMNEPTDVNVETNRDAALAAVEGADPVALSTVDALVDNILA